MTATAALESLGKDIGRVLFNPDRVRSRAVKIVSLTISPTEQLSTFSFVLKAYGLKTLLGIRGVVHTTSDSVIVLEAPTTSVSAGTVTVTLGTTGGNSKVRHYIIIGEV